MNGTLAGLVFAALAAVPTAALPAGGSVTLVDHGGPVRFASLAQALAVAKAGDTLLLADGVYKGPENTGLVVDFPITILGSGTESCVIDCGGSARAFLFHDDVRLEGLTIRNGSADYGGGVACDGPSDVRVELTRVNFEANRADYGGALGGFGGGMQLSQCRFEGNDGDGVTIGASLTRPVSATLDGCTFVGNRGSGLDLAGLIVGLPDQISIRRSRFVGNGRAGLSSFLADRVTVDGCLFVANRGGGVSYIGDLFNAAGSSIIVRNSWIVDNMAASAAGVAAVGGAFVLQGSTVANNIASDDGPGGVSWGGVQGILALNSILWGNTSPEPDLLDQQILVSHGMTLALGSDIQGLPALDTNLSADPLFVDAAAGDYHLAPTSPCIDAGVPFGLAATQLDIDGQPRLIGAGFDIGGDEFAF